MNPLRDQLLRPRWSEVRPLAVSAGLAILVALASGCGRGSAQSLPPSSTTAAEVRHGHFESQVLLTGELQAIRADKIIVPRTPQWQMPIRWMAADGAEVRAGERVLELDNGQFAGELEQNRLAESRALNELMRKDADIAIDLTEKRLAVDRTRIELQKARLQADVPPELVKRREYQELQLALAKAEVAAEKAREDLDAAQKAADAELEELRIALADARNKVRIAEEAIGALTLYAPSDGILVVAENRREGRKFKEGDNVWVGLPVMSVPDLGSMKVEALLSDVDDGSITPGMRAVCTLDTYPESEFAGEVVDISPMAKEQGHQSLRRAFRVTVHLDSTDPERMRPGMSVKVAVVRESRPDALLVPRAALDLTGTMPRAWLADGSVTQVALGPCNALACVVESGLVEGQRLGRRGG